MDGAPCAYLMHKHDVPPTTLGPSHDCAKSFNNQMIKCYPIIKTPDLLLNMPAPDLEPPLKFYIHEAAEDNAQCFQELKCIVQGTEAEVYVDEFIVHSEFCAVWRKLYNTFLSTGANNMLAAQLEKTIQNLCYNGPKHDFMFTTYIERHKATYQSMLALVKKTDYTAYNPSTWVHHFLYGITDLAPAQATLSLEANLKQ